ncbi:3'-5' exonuclease [Ornithinibacillus massiliensis]|uniref:3'-5' exonuclease n=1 Tax=Ornithinibacillus massiliensis TaxID=1944633 RepID=A0ABS5ME78_9BACI|nr:3'-5' exonuclease [Ornithinibacillus massiliensis]MBS3680634.1 3'-5' exonuclease [Ornithinibacillus massiliensis]
MNFVSIDFETANEKRHSPCAVGIVIADEKEILDEYYSLINPETYFNPFNIRVHGIVEEDVLGARTFSEIWPTLETYLSGNLVVAHNASFDMSVIRQSLDRDSMTYPELDYLCTANIAKYVWPELENHKLNTLAAHHGFALNHHNALEDARVAAKVMQKAMESVESNSIEAFLKQCQITKGRIFERGYYPPKVKRTQKKKPTTLYF